MIPLLGHVQNGQIHGGRKHTAGRRGPGERLLLAVGFPLGTGLSLQDCTTPPGAGERRVTPGQEGGHENVPPPSPVTDSPPGSTWALSMQLLSLAAGPWVLKGHSTGEVGAMGGGEPEAALANHTGHGSAQGSVGGQQGWGPTDLLNVESFHLKDQVLDGPPGDLGRRKRLEVTEDGRGVQSEGPAARGHEGAARTRGQTPGAAEAFALFLPHLPRLGAGPRGGRWPGPAWSQRRAHVTTATCHPSSRIFSRLSFCIS